jgi:hypothetical protein
MGKAVQPSAVSLFIGFMFQSTVKTGEILDMFRQRFGDIEFSYGPTPFLFTEYYKEEMGTDLRKMYLTFRRRIRRDELAAIKIFSNDLERAFCSGGFRTINIDPGYVARDKLVLASTKDFYHRIYLSQGVFAEVTLHYRRGKFRFFSWTYPDYKDEAFLAFLERTRARLVKELRQTP